MILGLDLSTSISGLTVIDDVGKVLHCSHIDLKKFDSLYNKTEQVRFILKQIIFDNYTLKPDKVFIESSLLTFAGGKSSASVIATLTKMNGIISYIIERDFCIVPEFIMATSARKNCGIKIVKNGTKAKEQCMQHFIQNEKWFVENNLQYKKTGKIKDFCYDEMDSAIIARAGFIQSKQQ